MNKPERDELRRAWLALDAAFGDELAESEPLAEVDDAESAAAPARTSDAYVTRVRAMVDERLDEKWRELLAHAREQRRTRPIKVVPASPERTRPELLARLAELRTSYPTLALHHRDLEEMSDDMLSALVEDIEAVIAHGDE